MRFVMCGSQMDLYALERVRWTLLAFDFDFLSWPKPQGQERMVVF